MITKKGAKRYQVDKISQHIRNMRHQEEQRRSLERLNLPYTPPKPISSPLPNIQPRFSSSPSSAQHLRMLSINNQNQQNYMALQNQPHFGFSPHVEFEFEH